MPSFTKDYAHQWFRNAGAPLIIDQRVRLKLTLARCVPLLLWVQASTVAYLFLWRGFVHVADNTPTSPETLFIVLVLLLLLPPPVLAVIPWLVWRNQRRFPLWVQSIIGALLIPLTAFVMSAPVAGVPELADMGGFMQSFLITAVLVLAVYLGFDTLLVWVMIQTWRETRSLTTMVAKVLPVLMLAVLFFFVNGDIWRVADALSLGRTIQVSAILGALAIFVIDTTVMEKTTKLLGKRRGDRLERFTWEEYAISAEAAAPEWENALGQLVPEELDNPVPISRGEWYNLIFLPILVQTIQAFLFGVLVCVFFVWFGTIAIPDATITQWLGHQAAKVQVGDTQLPFTGVLVKVSMVLGGFATLNFVAQTASDRRYADEFLQPTIDHLRQTVMLRNIFRAST